MADARRPARSEWLAGALVVALVIAGYALAIAASGAPQAYDADSYIREARSFVAGSPRLEWAHNYGYAVFLAVLQVAGLGDRLAVALVQVTLLYAAALGAAVCISRSTHASIAVAMVPLAAVALVPAAAWTGYALSEGLAAPLLLLVFGLTILITYRMMRLISGRDVATVVLVALLGLLTGLVWMTRPGLVWIPASIGLLVLGLGVYVAWRGDRRALLSPVVFGVALVVVVAPQFQLADPFKLDLARTQAGLSELYFRYATSLTGCGPDGVPFSPLAQSILEPEAASALAPDNPQWRLTTMVAHIVTGWDARPSPTYMERYADRRWLVLTSFSGFAIMAVVSAAAIFLRRVKASTLRTFTRPRTVVLGVLVLLFIASQAVVAITLAEFRFNLAGWLVAACSLAVITGLRWWTTKRAVIYVLLSLFASGIVLIIGQMTLMYSPFWLRCSGYFQGA